MSILVGKICGAAVKALAGATIANGVEKGINTIIRSTGVLKTATKTTKTVVTVGTIGAGIIAGDMVVDKLVDIANSNGTPIIGKQEIACIDTNTYTERGILIGVPEHKKNKKDIIKVDVVGGPE